MLLRFTVSVYHQLASTKLQALGNSLPNLSLTVKIFLFKKNINTTLSDVTFNGTSMPINRLIFDQKQEVANGKLLTC